MQNLHRSHVWLRGVWSWADGSRSAPASDSAYALHLLCRLCRDRAELRRVT